MEPSDESLEELAEALELALVEELELALAEE